MPPKVTKEMSSLLIKYVKSVNIALNPIDARTRSARELLQQIQCERFAKANPKLSVAYDFHGRVDSPIVHFKFIDDKEKKFESEKRTAKEMMDDVFTYATGLDIEYELAGKSIEDV